MASATPDSTIDVDMEGASASAPSSAPTTVSALGTASGNSSTTFAPPIDPHSLQSLRPRSSKPTPSTSAVSDPAHRPRVSSHHNSKPSSSSRPAHPTIDPSIAFFMTQMKTYINDSETRTASRIAEAQADIEARQRKLTEHVVELFADSHDKLIEALSAHEKLFKAGMEKLKSAQKELNKAQEKLIKGEIKEAMKRVEEGNSISRSLHGLVTAKLGSGMPRMGADLSDSEYGGWSGSEQQGRLRAFPNGEMVLDTPFHASGDPDADAIGDTDDGTHTPRAMTPHESMDRDSEPHTAPSFSHVQPLPAGVPPSYPSPMSQRHPQTSDSRESSAPFEYTSAAEFNTLDNFSGLGDLKMQTPFVTTSASFNGTAMDAPVSRARPSFAFLDRSGSELSSIDSVDPTALHDGLTTANLSTLGGTTSKANRAASIFSTSSELSPPPSEATASDGEVMHSMTSQSQVFDKRTSRIAASSSSSSKAPGPVRSSRRTSRASKGQDDRAPLEWPPLQQDSYYEDGETELVIYCDKCTRGYHHSCVGLEQRENRAKFHCPFCQPSNSKARSKSRTTNSSGPFVCARPDCPYEVEDSSDPTEKEWVIEGIFGRRGIPGAYEVLLKWWRYPIGEGEWKDLTPDLEEKFDAFMKRAAREGLDVSSKTAKLMLASAQEHWPSKVRKLVGRREGNPGTGVKFEFLCFYDGGWEIDACEWHCDLGSDGPSLVRQFEKAAAKENVDLRQPGLILLKEARGVWAGFASDAYFPAATYVFGPPS